MAAETKEEASEGAAAPAEEAMFVEMAKEEAPAAATTEVEQEEAKVEPKATEEASKSKVNSREELEKKALQEFKVKVEEAIKANEFALPPTPSVEPKVEKEEPKEEQAKTEEPLKPSEEPKVEESKNEELKVEKKEDVPATTEELKVEEEESKEAEPVEEVFLWGIPLALSDGDERTEVILTKFLQARDFKVPAALAMLKSTVLWRKTYKTDSILEEPEEESGFDALAFMFGVDQGGHPVCYNVFGALQDKELYARAVGEDSAKFLRWRVRLLEKGIRLLSFQPSSPNELIQVIDLKNSPWPAKKEVRSLLGQAIGLLQDNYPELVIKNVFINVPWYYSAIYSIISPFLTQRQKNKIVIARPGKSTTEALFKFISPENVPLQYGGLGKPGDATYEGTEAPPVDLVVKAGEKKTAELTVTTSGAAVAWDLVVVGSSAGGSDLSYGAEFVPDKEGGYTTIIEKAKKFEEPVRGTFTTSEPGKVVLTLDNSASRKKKLVIYRHVVKASAGETKPETELELELELEQQQQQPAEVELDA